ncbi:MAG: LamG domain-containing protein, partial [Planctomycetota bacterium]
MRSRTTLGALVLYGLLACASWSRAESSWFDALIKRREASGAGKAEVRKAIPLPDFGNGSYTVTAWIRTTGDGTIFAKTAPRGDWVPGGKSLFVRGGRVSFDVGFVGCVDGRSRVADGKWHHVAFTGGSPQCIYVDGVLDGDGRLERRGDVGGNVFKLGSTSNNFPSSDQFRGELDDVRVYGRALSAKEIKEHFRAKQPGSGRGLVAYWPFDGDTRDASGSLNHASSTRDGRYVAGKFGKAVKLARGGHLTVQCGKGQSPDAALWASLGAEVGDDVSRQEMRWERADGIWGADWKTAAYHEVARRYASSAQRPSAVARQIGELAAKARTAADLKGLRALYLKSKRYGQLLEKIAEFK